MRITAPLAALLFFVFTLTLPASAQIKAKPVDVKSSDARPADARVEDGRAADARSGDDRASEAKPNIIPLGQIHPGMRGTALTVFQGVKPESMDVEVLGILRNVNGPKGDVILVRLHGAKPEYTGVVAGMSGSPVYFDGKLAGALV
ncbi:MAG: hypothetical protein ACRD3Q_18865, partial [Terriglobales bacterium]